MFQRIFIFALYLELGEEKKALDDFSAAAGSGEKCYDAYFAMYNIYMGMGDNANDSAFSLFSLIAVSKCSSESSYLPDSISSTALSYSCPAFPQLRDDLDFWDDGDVDEFVSELMDKKTFSIAQRTEILKMVSKKY